MITEAIEVDGLRVVGGTEYREFHTNINGFIIKTRIEKNLVSKMSKEDLPYNILRSVFDIIDLQVIELEGNKP